MLQSTRAAPERAGPALRVIARINSRRVDIAKALVTARIMDNQGRETE